MATGDGKVVGQPKSDSDCVQRGERRCWMIFQARIEHRGAHSLLCVTRAACCNVGRGRQPSGVQSTVPSRGGGLFSSDGLHRRERMGCSRRCDKGHRKRMLDGESEDKHRPKLGPARSTARIIFPIWRFVKSDGAWVSSFHAVGSCKCNGSWHEWRRSDDAEGQSTERFKTGAGLKHFGHSWQ